MPPGASGAVSRRARRLSLTLLWHVRRPHEVATVFSILQTEATRGYPMRPFGMALLHAALLSLAHAAETPTRSPASSPGSRGRRGAGERPDLGARDLAGKLLCWLGASPRTAGRAGSRGDDGKSGSVRGGRIGGCRRGEIGRCRPRRAQPAVAATGETGPLRRPTPSPRLSAPWASRGAVHLQPT